MISVLKNVTVIIPAHNRPERLRRLLGYYSGCGLRILVPDSSDQCYNGDVSSPDVTYIHRPGLHFLLKIKEILPLISTDYVLYCADDDFIVPSAIASMVEFLDDNPDYSIAQGHYLTFTPKERGVEFYPRYIRYFDSRIVADDPPGRLLQDKCKYASLLYGVARTEQFRSIYGYCFGKDGELRFRNLFLAEEFFNHAMLIHGKYATIPCFYSARERIKGSATETVVPISEIRSSDEYRWEYDGFIDALSLMLSDKTGMEYDESNRFMRKVCASPKDSADVSFKRKIVVFMMRHRWLRRVSDILDWRYNQKGLKAVRGMTSYPCGFSTPEKEAIIKVIEQYS